MMKKIYGKPASSVADIQVQSFLAESLGIKNGADEKKITDELQIQSRSTTVWEEEW